MQQEFIINTLKIYGCECEPPISLKDNNGFLIYSTETIDNSNLKSLYENYCKDINNKKEKNIFRYFYYRDLQNMCPLHATIIMMNPAFADSEASDDTISNIESFIREYNKTCDSEKKKFGSFDIVNLFPVRMPKSAKLNKLLDATKSKTPKYQKFVESYLKETCKNHIIIAAWGSKYHHKGKELFGNINEIKFKCYAINASSQSPKHFGSMAFNRVKSRELKDYYIT